MCHERIPGEALHATRGSVHASSCNSTPPRCCVCAGTCGWCRSTAPVSRCRSATARRSSRPPRDRPSTCAPPAAAPAPRESGAIAKRASATHASLAATCAPTPVFPAERAACPTRKSTSRLATRAACPRSTPPPAGPRSTPTPTTPRSTPALGRTLVPARPWASGTSLPPAPTSTRCGPTSPTAAASEWPRRRYWCASVLPMHEHTADARAHTSRRLIGDDALPWQRCRCHLLIPMLHHCPQVVRQEPVLRVGLRQPLLGPEEQPACSSGHAHPVLRDCP